MYKQQGCSIGAALFCVAIRICYEICSAGYELPYIYNMLSLNIIF